MTETAIRVEGLGKCYTIRHESGGKRFRYRRLSEELTHGLAACAWALIPGRRGSGSAEPGSPPSREPFWALRDIAFEVRQGEVVGVIGRNGVGKSTLLKILSRITEPTEGRVCVRGRVASLLEVGTGFHPELTGRENIFLNGTILGMTRREIQKKFDEIVAFAEIEKFLDTPVKRYSSGMYVRLAFSVAAHLDSEILLVDEVLAVGDAQFQKKCLARIRDVASGMGRTVLFVSHNMGALTSLCQSAIWLNDGRIVRTGQARKLVEEYLTQSAGRSSAAIDLGQRPRYGDHGHMSRLERLEWVSPVPHRHGQAIVARVTIRAESAVDEASIGVGFSTLEGTRLLTYETDFPSGDRPDLLAGRTYRVDIEIPECCLAPGLYLVDVGARSGDTHCVDFLSAVEQVEIAMGPTTPGYIARQGAGVRLGSSSRWLSDS